MNLKHIQFITLFLITVIFISGCTQENPITSGTKTTASSGSQEITPQQTVSDYHPTNINTFSSSNEGDVIRFYFLLENQDGQNTLGSGEANVQIKDSVGNVVFSQKFDFKSSDFVDYQFKLTGQGIGKAYEWRVNQKDIQKGISEMGKADLTITLPDGKVINATDDYVSIPSYSEEEIKQMYDALYNKNAQLSGEIVKKGDFEVTLVKYGFFKHLELGAYGDEVTDFRVDLKVKNIGSEKNSFSNYAAVLIVGSHQYERSFNSELDSSDIYPGIIKEGYLLFKDVPTTITGKIDIIAGTSYDEYYNEFTYKFDGQI